MDETRWEPDDWCEQARKLIEQAERRKVELLASLLEHIEAGILLRRPLDRQPPDTATEGCRRDILRRLAGLRLAVGDLIEPRELDDRDRQVLARHVKNWLSEYRTALRHLLSDHTLDRLGRALAVEGMRYDLEWLNVLVARLDHDLPPSRSARLEVELDRIHNELTRLPATSQRSDDQQERLLARCERLRGVLLGRRIEIELGRSSERASAERLLILRLEHSRLQARVAAIEATNDR